MAQHSNEHLTSTQLSAYLDKELSPDELALCDAHLLNCQICQSMLADLRLTSTLLRGLPQVEVPRSFVLPATITVLSERSLHREQGARQPARGLSFLKKAARPLATLAAILGILFILIGAISAIPNGQFMATSSNASVSAPSTNNYGQNRTANPSLAAGRNPSETQPVPEATNSTIASGLPTPDQAIPKRPDQTDQPQPVGPPVLVDPGQPVGRLGIGALLLILGILGLLLTRRSAYGHAR